MNSDFNVGDIVQDNERAWVQVDEGVQVKVMYVSEQEGIVVVLTKMAANTQMPTHHHHCATYNYTVSGEWEYAEGAVAGKGSHAYEPIGVRHTPITVQSDMVLFSVFTAKEGKLFTYNPDTEQAFDIDINVFIEFEKMCIDQALSKINE